MKNEKEVGHLMWYILHMPCYQTRHAYTLKLGLSVASVKHQRCGIVSERELIEKV